MVSNQMKFNKIIELNEVLSLSNIVTYGAPYYCANLDFDTTLV